MQPIISYRQIGNLALPIMLSQSVILINGLIDLAFIAPYGTEAIAAVSIANALCATLFNFLEGFRIGTTVLIAKAAATGNTRTGAAVVNTGLFLVSVIGVILAVFAAPISDLVYDFVGNEPIRQQGWDYLRIWLWAVPIILYSYVLAGLFRGLRDTATPLYSGIAVCCLNVLFAYLFVRGGFGFPSLGVKGSAWATLLANLIGLAVIMALAIRKPLIAQYINRRQAFFNQLREYAALAADVGLNTGFTLLALLTFVGIIKQLGAGALAVHQITLQVFNFGYLSAIGFLITASILVPQLLEQNRADLLVPTVKRLCQMSFGVIFVISSALFAFSPAVGSFFSPADPAVAAQTADTIRLVCIGQLFSSLYLVLRGALTGCQDTRFIVYEGLASGYLLFLPLAYLLAVKFGLGVYGGYIAFLLWCATDCSAMALRFFRFPRRRKAETVVTDD